MTDRVLKVLLLEDMKTDQELIKRQVLKVAPKSMFTIADSHDSFHEKIKWMQPDIILADYRLPDFNGLEALLHVRKTKAHTPFIFVTGALSNEQEAADAILKGASGFILKGNLNQLPEKLSEILNAADAEREQMEHELQLQQSNKLLLQKAYNLTQQANSFDKKEDILKILEEMQQNFGITI